ncbi:DUF802 domain-containing protein [Aquabacterium sp.]|uniref:DUF802 domain-containing protein n=1 Tax=Aquabacterium sp. TaxID=1872578 RepID=UPI0025C4A9BD|nr:DUF802 domain-containing protein [Aquabacterium sp.]
MNRLVFNAAFTLGLLAVAWVAWGFVGGGALPLAMTALIAGVYLLGGLELHRFRQATAGLAQAMAELPDTLDELGPWLARVPASLRQPVRLRIEGQRAGLPGPALTPYLIGLLVMLGMLGTFLGMVLTFKGAVFALEGSTDLQAIRAALAAPIKGLGLSFGTSVAGVAASAVLGLVSALSRRERMAVSRELDARIATSLRPFSLAQQRQATFEAIQAQSQALPAVAERLQALMDGLERRSQQLNEQLLGQQAQFHRDAATVYTDLAQNVGRALSDSLRASTQAASESLTPVVRNAMEAISAESALAHQRLSDSTRGQLDEVARRFGDTAAQLGTGWTQAQQAQAQTNAQLVDGLARHLNGFSEAFAQRSHSLLDTVGQSLAQTRADQAAADAERLAAWTRQLDAQAEALRQAWQQAGAQNLAQQEAVCADIAQAARQITERSSEDTRQVLEQMRALLQQADALVAARSEAEARWQADQRQRMDAHIHTLQQSLAENQATQAAADQQRLSAWSSQLETLGATLHREWQQSSTQTLEQQRAVCLALEQTAAEITERVSAQATRQLDDITRLLDQSEGLVRSRLESESRWVAEQGARMDQLAGVWRSELAALRQEEAGRGEAAVARLASLQTTLTGHLDTLHQTLARTQTAQAEGDQARLQAWQAKLDAMASALQAEWARVGSQTLSQQEAVCLALEKTASEITTRVSAQASAQLDGIATLLNQSETLVRSRLESESQWVAQQGQRMDQLAGVWRQELAALRADEAQRGETAVARLGELQAALATQLATLGSALEAPMTRLMQTAADVPQAAAAVLTELRQETARLGERDQQTLAERQALMAQLHTLLQAVQEGTGAQQAAIAQLSQAARHMLDEAAARHADTLSDQARQASEATALVAGSAVDLASLGEAFQQGMQAFQGGNERLVESLQRIDSAIQQSIARSDEQLAYYVAQAREVIDLSISAQQGIVEDLRLLRGNLHAQQASEGAAG